MRRRRFSLQAAAAAVALSAALAPAAPAAAARRRAQAPRPSPPKGEPARLRGARQAQEEEIAALFAKAAVAYPPGALLLRAFKAGDELELWAGPEPGRPLALVSRYRICARSGGPGPKLRQGDGQVPEGFYSIRKLNPWSRFHLSLEVDYPNAADRARSARAGVREPGGEIFIHGSCVTIGCLPIEDGPIEQLYVIAVDARARGAPIAVHLFPARPGSAEWDRLSAGGDAETRALWSSLREGYDAFESSRIPPAAVPTETGRYRFP